MCAESATDSSWSKGCPIRLGVFGSPLILSWFCLIESKAWRASPMHLNTIHSLVLVPKPPLKPQFWHFTRQNWHLGAQVRAQEQVLRRIRAQVHPCCESTSQSLVVSGMPACSAANSRCEPSSKKSQQVRRSGALGGGGRLTWSRWG